VNQDFIDVVIIGVNNSKQLKQNITALKNTKEYHFNSYQFDEHLITPSEWPK
jgi:aryl-alcohol dehydrogenase-like predicted oxidoreductase